MKKQRKFYLYPREKSGIYYVYYKHPITGKKLSGISTHTRDYDEAYYLAIKWLREGRTDCSAVSLNHTFTIETLLKDLKSMDELNSQDADKILEILKEKDLIAEAQVKHKSGETLIQFLYKFWNYENSPYVEERLASGLSIGRRRCKDTTNWVKNYWAPYFQDKLLTEVTRKDIKAFKKHLGKKDKAAKTKTNILDAGTVALNWALDNELVTSSLTQGIGKFAGETKKRGILSYDETIRLFTDGDWKNNYGAKLASLVAMETGMRGGEILALKVKDVKEKLNVHKSFSVDDGMKSTKTGDERESPLLSYLQTQMLEYAKQTPHNFSENSFIFFQFDSPDKPTRQETLNKRLKGALDSIGLTEEIRNERNIVFHSWRHFFAKNMRAEIDLNTMKLLGHTTQTVFNAYSSHKEEMDYITARDAVERKFSLINETLKNETFLGK